MQAPQGSCTSPSRGFPRTFPRGLVVAMHPAPSHHPADAARHETRRATTTPPPANVSHATRATRTPRGVPSRASRASSRRACARRDLGPFQRSRATDKRPRPSVSPAAIVANEYHDSSMTGTAQPGQDYLVRLSSAASAPPSPSRAPGSRSRPLAVNTRALTLDPPTPPLSSQRAAYAYDPYGAYGGMMAYSQQTMVAPHVMSGLQSARMMLPSEMEEEPVYVNAKQYHGILRRRAARAKAESENRLIKSRKPYLHESRHNHAQRRERGAGGRFLTKKELAEMAAKKAAEKEAGRGAKGRPTATRRKTPRTRTPKRRTIRRSPPRVRARNESRRPTTGRFGETKVEQRGDDEDANGRRGKRNEPPLSRPHETRTPHTVDSLTRARVSGRRDGTPW